MLLYLQIGKIKISENKGDIMKNSFDKIMREYGCFTMESLGEMFVNGVDFILPPFSCVVVKPTYTDEVAYKQFKWTPSILRDVRANHTLALVYQSDPSKQYEESYNDEMFYILLILAMETSYGLPDVLAYNIVNKAMFYMAESGIRENMNYAVYKNVKELCKGF